MKTRFAFLLLLIWAALAGSAIASPKKITIVALGDSLTEGYQLNKTDAYPAQLEALLKAKVYEGVKILNHGISGDTTAGGRARTQRVISAQPDIVIMALGPNDFLRGLPPASTHNNLEYIVKKLTEANIRVIVVGFNAAPNMGPEFQRQFDAIFPALKNAYPITLTYRFLDGVAGNLKLNLDDGIHPNASGYSVIAHNLLPIIEKEMQQLK